VTDRIQVWEYSDREAYLETQIKRSQSKFGYCKVYLEDVVRYRQLLSVDLLRRAYAGPGLNLQPILCLGVRSGAEVDLFRAVFFGPLMRLPLVQQLACHLDRNEDAQVKIRLGRLFGVGSGRLDDSRVMGVEINPECNRPDVYNGSFDKLPETWFQRFRLLFSDSFDHSMDPERTVHEWKRVAASRCYVILSYGVGNQPSPTDPTGGLSLAVMCDLWKSQPIYYSETANRTGYHEVIFRL